MYIIYSGANDRYASAAVSTRNGKDTSITYQYLGTVIDKEKGIYRNRERGLFTFDVKTGEYGLPPDDYEPPRQSPVQKRGRVSVDFGDAYFLNAFLWKSGLMDIVDRIAYGNRDTLHAMLLFYTLSNLSNCDAVCWYEGSIVQLLYPRANLRSQRISDCLSAIGTAENQMAFQKAYLGYVFSHYDPDRNMLIDSSGLPNSIHIPFTCMNVHNGKVSNETRLIFVVQRSTGIPLYYRAVPGNIVDVSTLERIFLHLDSLGVSIDSCIMDAGYNSKDNLDLFYDENHVCKIGFITRVKSSDSEFRTMVAEELATIDQAENFVKYEDRYLFIKKKKIMVGTNADNPAWLYMGLDCERLTSEQHKLFRRAGRDGLTLEEVYEAMQMEGLFGVISGTEYECKDILPAYYLRQAAEQIFDFAKNYTKLLPLRVSTEATFQGHLLLSFIASCAVKMIQLRLKTADFLLGSRLLCMRNQKCTIYANRVVTDNPQKDANDTYKVFGIDCPASIPLTGGVLQYTPPESDTLPPERKKRSRKPKKQNELPDNGTAAAQEQLKKSKKQATASASEKKAETTTPASIEKRKRGRPKGSKNKKTLEREEAMLARNEETVPKRKPGRPKGAKNKKKH